MNIAEEIRNFRAEGISAEGAAKLAEAARRARMWAVAATSAAKSGHPAGALSSMDIYMTLLGAANVSPELADSPERDRIVVSHGHTSAGFYAALAEYGFFDAKEMAANFRRTGSPYQGHVERDVPGVDWGTGNLGQGLSAGVGFALAARARGSKARTWVVMGDGEQVKGQVAEARRIAVKEKLASLTAIVDWNDIQISGRLEEVMPVDIPALWAADGWKVIECCGHDYAELYKALKEAAASDVPAVVLCHTTMGKGVSFMENIPDYHGKPASGDKLEEALKELGGDMALFESVLEGKHVTVKTEKLKDENVPVVINVSEFARRMSEMHSFYGMGESPADLTLVVNTANPAVAALKDAEEEARKQSALYLYYLALMSYRPLKPEELESFVSTGNVLVQNYLKK